MTNNTGMQKIANPCPRIEHPSWLQSNLNEKFSTKKQLLIKNIFHTISNNNNNNNLKNPNLNIINQKYDPFINTIKRNKNIPLLVSSIDVTEQQQEIVDMEDYGVNKNILILNNAHHRGVVITHKRKPLNDNTNDDTDINNNDNDVNAIDTNININDKINNNEIINNNDNNNNNNNNNSIDIDINNEFNNESVNYNNTENASTIENITSIISTIQMNDKKPSTTMELHQWLLQRKQNWLQIKLQKKSLLVTKQYGIVPFSKEYNLLQKQLLQMNHNQNKKMIGLYFY